jgi:hypothetical protein
VRCAAGDFWLVSGCAAGVRLAGIMSRKRKRVKLYEVERIEDKNEETQEFLVKVCLASFVVVSHALLLASTVEKRRRTHVGAMQESSELSGSNATINSCGRVALLLLALTLSCLGKNAESKSLQLPRSLPRARSHGTRSEDGVAGKPANLGRRRTLLPSCTLCSRA